MSHFSEFLEILKNFKHLISLNQALNNEVCIYKMVKCTKCSKTTKKKHRTLFVKDIIFIDLNRPLN